MSVKSLVDEIHRRSVWQVLTIYLAGSFGVLQAVDLLTKNIGLPDWVAPVATILLLIGLPLVLATAFLQQRPNTAVDAAPAKRSSLVLPASMVDVVPPAPQRLLTWRRLTLGGLLAFGALGFSTTGYVTMRALGIGPVGSLRAKGVLAAKAPIVVADFASAQGDTLLGRATTEAFRIDLAQSSDVKVFEPRQIAQALRRMERRPDAPVDLALASEIATREGAAAIVAGEISPVGRGFLLTVRLLGVKDGEELASLRESARDTAGVIHAIDRLSKGLREKVGESYRSLQSAPPLEHVTTASLDALRKYSQGIRAIEVTGNDELGIELLSEAVALDTSFAMAYRKLGVAFGNRFLERARASDALTRAYNHRDRLTQRERYLAEASYMSQAVWEPEKALVAYQNLVDLDSTDVPALNNIGVIYGRLNDFAHAAEYYVRAVRADSSTALPYTNGAQALVNAGRMKEARDLLARFRARFPTNPRSLESYGLMAAFAGDYDTAERMLLVMRDSATSSVGRAAAEEDLSDLEATRGHLDAAEQYGEAAIAEDESRKMFGSAVARVADLAALDIYVRRKPELAIKRMEAELQRRPFSRLHPLDRPYPVFARMYAAAGQPTRARALLAEYDAQVSAGLRNWLERGMYDYAQAEIALAENQPDEAIQAVRRAQHSAGCVRCEFEIRAQAFEAMGRPDSALVNYERYVGTPNLRAISLSDRWHLAATLERLGALYEQRGDATKAAEAYNRLIQLWQTADAELQPRVQAAREKLAQIVARRG